MPVDISPESGALKAFLRASPAHQEAIYEISHALHNQMHYRGVTMDAAAVGQVRAAVTSVAQTEFMRTLAKFDDPTLAGVPQIMVLDIAKAATASMKQGPDTQGLTTIFMIQKVANEVATHFERTFVQARAKPAEPAVLATAPEPANV